MSPPDLIPFQESRIEDVVTEVSRTLYNILTFIDAPSCTALRVVATI
jgi:hypothetical protein